MTLNDLRENLKKAYEAYIEYRTSNISEDMLRASIRGRKNMREMYDFAKTMTATPGGKTPQYYKVLIALVKAGDVYYHAKKHGIESALLFKLSMDYDQ